MNELMSNWSQSVDPMVATALALVTNYGLRVIAAIVILILGCLVIRGAATVNADIDIDESSGIDHGREVIKNALFRNKTNPYLIREFLLSADPMEHTLDPAYRFVF